MNTCTWATAALAAVLLTTTAPVFAQGSYVDPFTLKNRAPGKALAREEDVSVGAAIRTDERNNKGGLFSGPRGWIYWNYLADPKGYQNPNLSAVSFSGRSSQQPRASALSLASA